MEQRDELEGFSRRKSLQLEAGKRYNIKIPRNISFPNGEECIEGTFIGMKKILFQFNINGMIANLPNKAFVLGPAE